MRMRKSTVLIKMAAAALSVVILGLMPAKEVCAVNAGSAIARGIDVSKHNGTVNWGQVAAAGMDFTFIKVGSTKSGVDPLFAENITNAQAAGLKTGVYLYSYATTPEEAANEANLVLQWIAPYTVNYPVVFDIEDKCHKSLSSQQLIDIINAFCFTIDAAGYYPMVYSNRNMFRDKLEICGWDRWVAQYSSSCEYGNNVCFWQSTGSGRVNGVGWNVDLDYQYKDYSNLIIPEGFITHSSGNVRFYRNWRMQRGWVVYNENQYYLDEAGNLVKGWFTDSTGIHYLSQQDGSLTRGVAVIDGAEFFFSPEGNRLTGKVGREDGVYYYDPATGVKTIGWIEAEGQTYHTDEAGHIQVGMIEIGGQRYYFDEAGALVRNQELVLGDSRYTASPEGVLTEIPSEPVPETPAEPAPGTSAETAPTQGN